MRVTAVHDLGNDVLAVSAVDDDGQAVELVDGPDGNQYAALGWVSATTNYYPPDAYGEFYVDENGEWQPVDQLTPADWARDTHLKPGAQPRAMTPAEVGEYAQSLLPAAPSRTGAPVQPTPIAFEAS